LYFLPLDERIPLLISSPLRGGRIKVGVKKEFLDNLFS